MQKWKCRYCGCSDGALGCPWPVWQLVKCYVCLRVERYEECCVRNVMIQVVNPHLMKFPLKMYVSDWFPLDAVLLRGVTT